MFLVVLVAVVGACVLADRGGARRASTALTRFKESSRSADVEIASEATPRQVAQLRRLPGVAAVGALQAFGLVVPRAPDFQSIGAPADRAFGTTVDRDRLIAGAARALRRDRRGDHRRGARQPARPRGRRPPARADLLARAIAQGARGRRRRRPAAGPRDVPHRRHRARPLDLGERTAAGGLCAHAADVRGAGSTRDRVGVFGTLSGISRRTRVDVPRVIDGTSDACSGRPSSSRRASRWRGRVPGTPSMWWCSALLIATGVLAVGGLVVIGIVLSRELAAMRPVLDRLGELGCTARNAVGVALAAPLLVALAGGLLAVAGAVALSPRFPVGIARRVVDPDVGLHVDWVVVVIGFALVALAVLVIAALASWASDPPGARATSARAHHHAGGTGRRRGRGGLRW